MAHDRYLDEHGIAGHAVVGVQETSYRDGTHGDGDGIQQCEVLDVEDEREYRREDDVHGDELLGGTSQLDGEIASSRTRHLVLQETTSSRYHHRDDEHEHHDDDYTSDPVGDGPPQEKSPVGGLDIRDDRRTGGGESADRFEERIDEGHPRDQERQRTEQEQQYPDGEHHHQTVCRTHIVGESVLEDHVDRCGQTDEQRDEERPEVLTLLHGKYRGRDEHQAGEEEDDTEDEHDTAVLLGDTLVSPPDGRPYRDVHNRASIPR